MRASSPQAAKMAAHPLLGRLGPGASIRWSWRAEGPGAYHAAVEYVSLLLYVFANDITIMRPPAPPAQFLFAPGDQECGLFELLLLWVEKRCSEFFMQMVIEIVCHAPHYLPLPQQVLLRSVPAMVRIAQTEDRIVLNSDCDLTPNIEIQLEKATVER